MSRESSEKKTCQERVWDGFASYHLADGED